MLKKIFKRLQTIPLYLVLLPVFFVLHGFMENFGFVSIKDAAILCFTYLLLSGSVAFFSWFVFRNITKAALITIIWMSFFFFFGAVHEFMKAYAPVHFFSRYSFLLSFFFIILVAVFIYLKKIQKPFFRFTLFLNLLFLTYIIVDLGHVLVKVLKYSGQRLTVYDFARNNTFNPCDTCAKPDIYFLLMDEYSSSLALREQYNYINDLDSFLLASGFSIQEYSRSNYNFTPFSMSATLNMSYISGIKDPKAVNAEDYASCNLLLRDNEVIKFLDAHGYEIVNYSVFDLAGNPAMVDQSFLPLKTKLISDRTLFARMNKDVGWLLMTWYPFKWFNENYILRHRDNNEMFLELTVRSAKEKRSKPRFIYAHFYLPHPPFYYDKHGNPKDNETMYREFKENPTQAYLEYLTYANGRIREMLRGIQQYSPNAIIILLSDHGYRKRVPGAWEPPHFFQNLNAVYFPDKDYQVLYDSITNVNMFRVILNKTFHQQFPVLKDSTIYLKDMKPVAH